MNESRHYPPPDFTRPPPDFIQPFHQQQQPRTSSFQPSMWSWADAPREPGWDSAQAGWQGGAGAGIGFSSNRGHYAPRRPYGQHFAGHRGGRHNYGPSNHQGHKKNKKEPEYSHFCDTCDRGFKNHEKYDEHISQHVKCSVPDCNFMAHEKIVSIHWKNNHASGAKRIKLDTPEEIAKWREERRKHYPTLQNIEKKKKVMELREETGAVLDTAQFGQMRGRGRGWGRGRGHNRGRGRGRGYSGFHAGHPRGAHQSSSPSERYPFPKQHCRDGDPLGALASCDHDSDRKAAVTESKDDVLIVPPKQMSSALGSLLANYGSMSESDSNDEPEAIPIQRTKGLLQENQALLHSVPPTDKDTGLFVNTKPFSEKTDTRQVHPNNALPNTTQNRRGGRGRGRRGGRGGHQDTPQSRRPTLLEMLLAPDIRHERNVLLQCVRYVVRNNFFGLDGERNDNRPVLTTTTTENDGSQLLEGDGVNSQSGSLVWRKKSLVEVNQEDIRKRESVASQEMYSEQTLKPDHVYPVKAWDLVDSPASIEEAKSLNPEETDVKAYQSPKLSSTDKVSLNIYDDDVWESSGATV
eukprot:XP_011604499.1 PREDICTED: nuclear fragile X mental retardation-interacting protein 1 [Takifugu rubripes]